MQIAAGIVITSAGANREKSVGAIDQAITDNALRQTVLERYADAVKKEAS